MQDILKLTTLFLFFFAIGFRGYCIETICESEIWGSPGCFYGILVSYKWQRSCSETCRPPSLSHSLSQSPPSFSTLSPPSLSKSQVTVAGVFRHLWLVFPLCPCPFLQPGKSHPVPPLWLDWVVCLDAPLCWVLEDVFQQMVGVSVCHHIGERIRGGRLSSRSSVVPTNTLRSEEWTTHSERDQSHEQDWHPGSNTSDSPSLQRVCFSSEGLGFFV